MADNISIQGGSEIIAFDDIAGVKVQRTKLQIGADGTSVDVSSANPIPVSDAGGSLTIDGTVASTQSGSWSQRNQDGSGTAITSSSTGTNAAKQALDVSLPSKLDTTSLTITAGSGTRTFGNIDTLGYVWWTAGFTATGSANGSMVLEGSHDGTTWFYFPMESIDSGGGVSFTASSTLASQATTSTFTGPLAFRYMRVKTTGTVTGTYILQVALTATALAKNIITVSGPTLETDTMYAGSTIQTSSLAYGFKGDIGSWTRLRTPSYFATSTATASGDTAVYTPTSGKKFRVMKYSIEVTSDAATSGGAVIDIVLRDATTALGMGASLYVPAVGGTAFGNGYSTGWRDVSNGKLSATNNNVLNCNLSAALTSGKVRVNVALCEE